jgi:hypothetical protein
VDDEESLSVPEDMRRQIRGAGFDIDATGDDPSQCEAVMRAVLVVKKLRSEGCTDNQVAHLLAKSAKAPRRSTLIDQLRRELMQTETFAIDTPALLPSWQRSLRAARRSPRTVQSYAEAAERFSDFLLRRGMPTAVDSIRREHVEAFIEELDARFKPATVGVRFRSLQQLFKWLLEEGEITSNPMERMRSPSVPEDPP